MTTTCPRCKKSVAALVDIPADLQLRLLDISLAESQYVSSCPACLNEIKKDVGNPELLKQKANSAQMRLQNLWISRGDVLKQAREALATKDPGKASRLFQSYIEILETVFEHKSGPLTPDVFRAMNKIEEMQTLLLVYWELVQIYDGHNERLMDQYSEQLVRFGKCSPVRMALLQKIKDYEPHSRFKKYIRRTDRELRGEKGLFSIFKVS